MDWLSFGLGAASIAGVPAAWVLIFLGRRRFRGLAYHNTAPPSSGVTTGQRR